MYDDGRLNLDDHLFTRWLSDSELGVWFASFMSFVSLLTCQKVSTRGDLQILSATPQRRSVSPHEYVATMRALEKHRNLHGPYLSDDKYAAATRQITLTTVIRYAFLEFLESAAI